MGGDTGHPSDIPSTFPAISVIRTEASPPEVPTPRTKTSTRAWSDPMRRLTMPGLIVVAPPPMTCTIMGEVTARDRDWLSGARLASVISTTWALTPSTSSHRVVNLARLMERARSVAVMEGVSDTEKICSLLLEVFGGRVMLFSLAFEDMDVDHWNMLLVFQFVSPLET